MQGTKYNNCCSGSLTNACCELQDVIACSSLGLYSAIQGTLYTPLFPRAVQRVKGTEESKEMFDHQSFAVKFCMYLTGYFEIH